MKTSVLYNPLFPLFRGGGGSGGSGGDYTNTPDNLRSTDTFEGLMGMCAGPIKGPVNDLKGVIMDGTPVLAEDGSPNFPDFVTIYSTGDPTLHPQIVNMRLGSASAPESVQLMLSNTTGTGTFVTKSLPNTGPNYIDLRFIVQQLFKQDKEGIYSESATLEIQMKKSGSSTWINPYVGDTDTWTASRGHKVAGSGIQGYFTANILPGFIDRIANGSGNGFFRIYGKTTSPTVMELRLWVPNTGEYENATWDVRVRLREKEEDVVDDTTRQRQIMWESIAAIYNDVIGEEEDWRGVSWLQLYGKATDNLKGVPEVEVITDTKIVSVPPASVYDPVARTFTGSIWDGSWVKAYTPDPAWVINDAISDPLFGLASFAPGAHLNKWDALEASKWFSEQVPDGAGGTHPRYSMNVIHNQPMKAEEFIQFLAGSVGAFAYDDGSGEWRMKVDKPEVPIDIFTLENIEGEFSYSHTDVDTRYNEYRGTFLNEEFDFREETIAVYDSTSIGLIGHKPTTIALIGCTNRQEALRRLMVRLRSSTRETRVVNFTTNRRADHLVPLETILVADGDLGDQDAKTTGRVVSISPDRMMVTVRDAIRMEVGVAYKMRFAILNEDYDPDADTSPTSEAWKLATVVDEIAVTNTSGQRGNITNIYLADPLPETAAEFLSVALEATGLTTTPKLYRILSVAKASDDDNERTVISAVEVDTGKWDAADNVDAQDAAFIDLRRVAPKPLLPIEGDLISLITTPAAQGLNHTIIGNFVRPLGSMVDGFRVYMSVNGGPTTQLVERTLIPQFDLVNPAHGHYTFYIHTITRTGVLSAPLIGEIVVDQQTLDAADLRYEDGQTIESLQPSQAGADPTGSNISAGILGQGDLATQDAVDFVTQVTGSLKPEAGATRNVTRGDWTELTAYAVGDIVNYAGSGYIAHTAHTSTSTFDDTKFYSFAEGGITPDIKFLRSNSTPTTPTGDSPAGWTDAPQSGVETLWMIRGNKNASGNLIGAWSAPASLTGLVFRGPYDNSASYLVNQTVTYGGGTYVALVPTTGHAPSGDDQANAWWDVIAAPGADGAPGDPPSAPTATINLTSGSAVNLRTVANANGYTGASDATYTFKVPAGVTIRGLSGGGRGIDTGTWPAGYSISLALQVENGGIVDGGGGIGANGSSTAGGTGGDAIYCQTDIAITVDSGGIVRAGGGGGGSGASTQTGSVSLRKQNGGGGGGGGFPNGAGGTGAPSYFISDGSPATSGGDGSPGTTSGGGAGGTASGGGNSGGAGGGAATAGSVGGASGGAGGAAGYAIRKNGHTVSVSNSGTITGTQS